MRVRSLRREARVGVGSCGDDVAWRAVRMDGWGGVANAQFFLSVERSSQPRMMMMTTAVHAYICTQCEVALHLNILLEFWRKSLPCFLRWENELSNEFY